MMRILRNLPETRAYLGELRGRGLRIGFVPTMGALHEGHMSLVEVAKTRSEVVVASVFVNPKQFGPSEDFERYPRDLEGDARRLQERGTSALFAPEVGLMYPAGFETTVSVSRVSQGLCGATRPGHFDGVSTVVLKLMNLVRPDIAVFGEKDFQQLAVIRAMVRDLNLDVEIVGAPIVRDPDGLAMSSRNAYLSPSERVRACAISTGLTIAERAFSLGERRGQILLSLVHNAMSAAAIEPEYLELRSFEDLAPLPQADRPSIILTAARVGSTRLIDNLILQRP